MSGRRISRQTVTDVLQIPAFMPGVQFYGFLWLYPTVKADYCKAENISREQQERGSVLFKDKLRFPRQRDSH
ncbi:hypothetical protein TNCV_5102591 [Trichonephila clavipes]|nr:hypothetical protein TNCV_5102591 [Trichonephila clavipes]